MKSIILIIGNFFLIGCNSHICKWQTINSNTLYLSRFKISLFDEFVNKKSYCLKNSAYMGKEATDDDALFVTICNLPEVDILRLFQMSKKYKWEKFLLIEHELSGEVNIPLCSIIFYKEHAYYGFSIDYYSKKVYNVNILDNFNIFDLKPEVEHFNNDHVIISEFNNKYEVVQTKIFIGSPDLSKKLIQIYKVQL